MGNFLTNQIWQKESHGQNADDETISESEPPTGSFNDNGGEFFEDEQILEQGFVVTESSARTYDEKLHINDNGNINNSDDNADLSYNSTENENFAQESKTVEQRDGYMYPLGKDDERDTMGSSQGGFDETENERVDMLYQRVNDSDHFLCMNDDDDDDFNDGFEDEENDQLMEAPHFVTIPEPFPPHDLPLYFSGQELVLSFMEEAARYARFGDFVSAKRLCTKAMIILDTSPVANKILHYRQCLNIFEQIEDHVQSIQCYYKCRMMEVIPPRRNLVQEATLFWNNLVNRYPDQVILETTNMILKTIEEFAGRGAEWHKGALSQIYFELSVTYEGLMHGTNEASIRHSSSSQWEYTMLLRAKFCFSMGHYTLVCEICKKVNSENSENSHILELWANTLLKLNKPELALKKADHALQISLNERPETESLRTLVKELESQIGNTCPAPHPDTIDYSWIKDTNVDIAEKQRAKQQEILNNHKKKKKRSRPKRMDTEQTDDKVNIDTADDNSESDPLIKNDSLDKESRQRHKTGDNSNMSAKSRTKGSYQNEVSPFEKQDIEGHYNIQDFSREDDTDYNVFVLEDDDSQKNLNSEEDLISIHDEVSSLMIKGISIKSRCVKSLAQGKYKYSQYDESEISEKEYELVKTKPKKFKRCKIQIESAHKAICTNMTRDDEIKEIEISGRSKCGKCFSEDEVLVEILNEEKTSRNDGKFIPRLSKRLQARDKQCKVYGVVKKTLKRNRLANIDHPVFVCVVDEFESHLMKPLCRTVPKLYIQKRNAKGTFAIDVYEYSQSRRTVSFKEKIPVPYADRHSFVFLVAYIKWDNYYPRGVVLRCIRTSGNVMNGVCLLKLIHRVPGSYDETLLKLAGTIANETQTADKNRHDLSGLVTFTIDPEDSTDLDDALSVEKLATGLYRVGVHISDVSSRIEKDCAIDKEAQERLITFCTGKGFEANHMLPGILSQDTLSLRPHELRQTISVFFVLDKNGLPRQKPMIQKTMIRSRRQFSYTEVQEIIDGKNDNLSKSINDLHELAKNIRKIRLREEMYSVQIDEDNIEDLDYLERSKDAHVLVEEFMILANQFVGKFLVTSFPDCVPLRCQNPPNDNEVEEWKLKNDQIYDAVLQLQRILPEEKSISRLNVSLMRYNKILPFQRWIWSSLCNAVSTQGSNMVSVLLGSDELHPEQALALVEWFRIQEKGYYKCSGQNDDENEEHFSMHIIHYTHFTSPIRRYVDVIVHRLVHAALDGQDSPYTPSEVERLCQKVNESASRAKIYQRECMTLLWGHNIQNKPAVVHVFAHEFTDGEIGFHVPLKTLSSQSKRIPLSQISPLKRPELRKDRETSRDQLTVVWQKRIYSFSGYGPKTRHQKKSVQRIDPDQRAVFQQKRKWFQILQMLVSDQVNNLTPELFDLNYHMSSSSRAQFNTETDVSSEIRDGELIQQTCDFEMIFHHAQVLAIQFMAVPIKGVLTPIPQLMDLTNNVKFCLEHMRDPVQVFERYATEKLRSNYGSCSNYLSVVLPLLRMEAATTAMQSASASMNDVPVYFETGGGQFTLLMSFCERRDLDFNSMAMDFLVTGDDEADEKIEYVPSSDYLCIRCDVQDGGKADQRLDGTCSPHQRMIWIGHGKIDKIKRMKKHGKIAVHFQLQKNSMVPSPKMQNKKRPFRCCIELLQKAEVERRSDAILQYLSKGSNLARAIALGKKPPQMSKDHFDFVKSVGTEPDIFMMQQTKYPRNNDKQTHAIRLALQRSFSLIQGPPGTGKTYTGVKLIYLFCAMNRLAREAGLPQRLLVFCGPSNKSVDLVARWVLKIFGEKAPCMVRVYGSSMENIDFPIPGKVFPKKARSRDGKPDRKLQEVSLHNLIRSDHNRHAKEIRRYDKLFRDNPAFSDIDEIKKYKSLLSQAAQEELKLYDVVFCTTAMATNPKFLKGTKGKVYQLIIDEAGMCTEPECIAPIIATQAKQVVLIGDHKQLRPTIICQYAADLGLARSLFERYANQATMLNMQYRMHPKICEFPSQTFYKGKLWTDMKHTSAWYEIYPLQIWPVFGTPLLFCHIVGTEEYLTVAIEEGNELSRSNKAEVEVVVKIVAYLLDIEKVNHEKINIMSQYNAQCYSMKDSLREMGFINLNINTVVASQGGEWDYVIFSTVRSLPQYRIEPRPSQGWCKQNLGFITDAHQINVALTRARKGLIIVGNRNLLRCEGYVWKPLIQNYGKQGCVVDADTFLSSL